jgi:hypothetical protein
MLQLIRALSAASALHRGHPQEGLVGPLRILTAEQRWQMEWERRRASCAIAEQLRVFLNARAPACSFMLIPRMFAIATPSHTSFHFSSGETP